MSSTQEPTSTSSDTPSISSSTTMPEKAPNQDNPTASIAHPSNDTIIIPREDLPHTPPSISYPPTDARAMSPRRNSAETDKISEEMRETQEHARTLQSGLVAIAEKIDSIKADHDRLEKQNAALQDYIGGLTRSLSQTGAAEGLGGAGGGGGGGGKGRR